LRERIIREGSITYEAFVDAALYDRDFGYYRQGKQDRLDYVTSPEIHSAFGRLIGRYIEKQFEPINAISPSVVELGGASGRLARDVLKGFSRFLPDHYYIIENGTERSEGRLQWVNSIENLPSDLTCVFVIANELFDALPFHRIVNDGGVLKEMYIAWDNGFYERPDVLSSDVKAFLDRYPISLPSGQATEVTPAMAEVVKCLSGRVHEGYFLIFDYGYNSASIEGGRFADGSAVGYRNRHLNNDILESPGTMDITHHVNFDHLTALLADHGWDRHGRIEQYRFLINCGILEDLMTLSDTERLRAKWLINPEGLGSMISVLGFSKNLSATMPGFGAFA
jgi:SAM-dependent MidA family methyltransferase